MAHHQHHGADYDAQVSRSLQSRPRGSSMSQMPIISEDEMLAEPDEPPDFHRKQAFTKTIPNLSRKESLLTKGLSTDTESHDEQPMPEAYFGHLPSVSSTTSTFSGRSNGDFTSDDGHHSPSTRASTPSSPRSVTNMPKILINSSNRTLRHASPSRHGSGDESPKSKRSSTDATPEPTVEAQLGRKRCITFACGGTKAPVAANAASPPKDTTTAAKRPCALKFVCPFTASKLAKKDVQRTTRLLSPAPVGPKTDSPRGFHRRHRDSDTTIKYESPKANKPQMSQVAASKRSRRASHNSDLARSEAYRFSEFANSDEEDEEWTRESTCFRSRLTVTDTLKKENDIRQLAEEADEEDAMDEEAAEYDDDDDDDGDDDDDLSDVVSEGGFQTDDEEGFADSDDDEVESDSDYEWWAPRKSRAASPFIGSDVFRPVTQRNLSGSSDDDDEQVRPTRPRGRQRTKNFGVQEVPVRPGTPELPDSTDFVCGTLDEDRPLEQAYISCLHEREAAKHRTMPQDIDPSFPTSDPEIETDEEDAGELVEESDQFFMHGRLDNIDQHEPGRGRRLSPAPLPSPRVSPRRMRSPPPPAAAAKKGPLPRSPAPRALFNRSSPRRVHSPAPANKLTSPPPSLRVSQVRGPLAIRVPFLGQRNDHLTHTASLPRSPHPFIRPQKAGVIGCTPSMEAQDDDDGEDTEHAKPYHRGAIDIAQGLERKRLKRREKFYKQYLKKEEKKNKKIQTRRPQPGRGAQRMRQVGLECATIRGTRMLSI